MTSSFDPPPPSSSSSLSSSTPSSALVGMATSPAPQLVDKKGQLWQERTVVVKRDHEGFGFTLSQQMPVFVDKIIENSSAQRAGILPGDRIIKVNGLSVVGHKHNAVVELIRDSSHVTLTVIGKMAATHATAANGTKATPTKDNAQGIEISPPRQLQELTQQSLRLMLQRQRRTYESLSVDYSKQQPSAKLEKELRDCESVIKILEMEIASKAPAIETHIHTTSASVHMLTGKSPKLAEDRALTRRLLGESQDIAPGNRKASVSKHHGTLKGSGESPKPSRAHTFSNGTISPSKLWGRHRLRQSGGDVVSDGSDDDLSDEVGGEAGPFSSLQELKSNPAHMAVFLHYLYLTKDPKNLLFYLVASSHQSQCKSVELLRQRGLDIYWTFFIDHAPLVLNVEAAVRSRILSTLETEDSESKLRSVFVEVRESLSEGIINDLANYRHKRIMGLAGMFGDHLLGNQMSSAKQMEVVYTTLTPDLKLCLEVKENTSPEEWIRSQAIAACVATFMLDAAGKSKDRNSPPVLEKIQAFTRGDILARKGKTKRKPPAVTRHGHTFHLTSYTKPTTCDHCNLWLWGVVYHGYQCASCDLNVHRYPCCFGELTTECSGQGKGSRGAAGRIKRTSAHRKPSQSTLSVIIAAEELELPESPRTEDEDDRLSPEVVGVASEGVDGEGVSAPPSKKRDRSTSEPKQHSHLIQSTSVAVGDQDKEPPVESPNKHKDIIRTQSERLHGRPDHVQKQLSVEPASWGSVTSCSSYSDGDSAAGKADVVVGTETGIRGNKLPLVDDDIKELVDDEIEDEPIPWALRAKREVLNGMKRYEIQRQEYIRELVYTEKTHLHKLKIMKYMYKVPLQKQSIITSHQAEQLFPSLEELILFHTGLCADLKERACNSNVVKSIADVLLQSFDGAAGERLCHACSVFASNQSKADKLIKEWKRKNERFRLFMKNTEMHPLSQRLALSDLMPIAWTRLTKYKLLIDNICSSYKKHWERLDEADKEEGGKVETALTCIKNILQYVNKQVRRAENKQRLVEYQLRLETVPMEKAQHPIAQLFKNLDLTSEGRRLLHQGPLTWKIQHRKVVELHVLLLTDILVLLERNEDRDKYYLRTHTLEGVNGTKEELSPVIRLKECLLRHAAADRGGRTFLVVNNSSLMKLAQMYEFIAEGPQEKKQWEEAIRRAMMGTQEELLSPELPSSPIGDEFSGKLPLGLSSFTSQLNPREQLDKIDDDMKRLMNDKLNILRGLQGGVGGHRMSDATPTHLAKDDTPKSITWAAIEQAGEITSTISHIMVPNPTKSIVAETQVRLTDIIHELQRSLSRLIMLTGGVEASSSSSDMHMSTVGSTDTLVPIEGSDPLSPLASKDPNTSSSSASPAGGEPLQFSTRERRDLEHVSRDDEISIPSPIPELDEAAGGGANEQGLPPQASDGESPPEFQVSLLPAAHSLESLRSDAGSLSKIIVDPPEIFSGGEDSETPTPPQDLEHGGGGGGGAGGGGGSETVTPVVSPSGDRNLLSPLSTSVFTAVNASSSQTCALGEDGDNRVFSSELKSFTPRPLSEVRARSESPAPSVRTLSDSALNRVGSEDSFKPEAGLASGSSTKKLSVFSSSERSKRMSESYRTIPSFTLSEEGSPLEGASGTTL